MTISNFYNGFNKGTLSRVESIMTELSDFNNITELVFTNVYTKDIASFEYNFIVTRHTIFFEMRKEDLVEMMWRFRMTKKEVEAQLRKQMNHNSELSIIITFTDEL
jgi:hypothetical protein